MKKTANYRLEVWVDKTPELYDAIKLVCGRRKPNIGAISWDNFFCYLNVKGGFPQPYLDIIVSDSRFQYSVNHRVQGQGSGSGYLGFIQFDHELVLRSYLVSIGVDVSDCPLSNPVPCGSPEDKPLGGVSVNYSLKLWLKGQKQYTSIKYDCDDYFNLGALSVFGANCCLNVNSRFPSPFIYNVLTHPKFCLSTNGRVAGNGGGTGFLGYICFSNENEAIGFLQSIGILVGRCLANPASGPIPPSGPPHNQSFDFIQVVQSWNTPVGNAVNFQNFYGYIIHRMRQSGRYVQINSPTVAGLNWPADCGVYVVRMRQQPVNLCDEIVYVGMTGKFNNYGKIPPGSGLDKRVFRVFPYTFTKVDGGPDLFEFGPNTNSYRGLMGLNPNARYSNSIKLDGLVFDCFTVDRLGFDAPAFLEAAILQAYLLNFKRLPAANNAF